MAKKMPSLTHAEIIQSKKDDAVIYIFCRNEMGDPFYAIVRASEDKLREYKTALENGEAIDIHHLDDMLYYGFSEGPPEDIREMFGV